MISSSTTLAEIFDIGQRLLVSAVASGVLFKAAIEWVKARRQQKRGKPDDTTVKRCPAHDALAAAVHSMRPLLEDTRSDIGELKGLFRQDTIELFDRLRRAEGRIEVLESVADRAKIDIEKLQDGILQIKQGG